MNCFQYYTQNLTLMSFNEAHYAEGRLEKEDINALKNYEHYYITAIALATATLAGKTAHLADTIQAAGESTIAAGFNIDIRADIDLLISESQKIQTITKPSSLTAGKDITMASGKDTQITGAKITAQNTTITAAQDKTTEQTNQKHAHAIPSHNKEFCSFTRHAKILTAGIVRLFRGLQFEHNAENGQNTKLCEGINYGVGLFGNADTGGIDASLSKSDILTTTYKNAIISANAITIDAIANTEIKGANLFANALSLNSGNNLTLESLQDKYFEHGINFGVGVSFEEGESSGASGNFGQTNGNSAWVNKQTSLYGTNSLTINTGKKTTFIGATANTGTGDLKINTGTLAYSDIQDRNYKTDIALQASVTKETTGLDTSQNQKEFETEISITDQIQRNKAAIGKGDITIKDNPNQDISDLNRNPNTAQTATDKINLKIAVETDTIKAFDPNTYKSLKNLPENIAQIGKNITREASDLIESLKNSSEDGALNDFMRKTAAREALLKIKANPQIKKILENQTDYTTAEIKAVTQYIAAIISKVRFKEPPIIQFYNGDQLTDSQKHTVNQFSETIDKSAASGFFDPDTATIFINAAKTNGSATNIVNVIANETSHYIDYKNKITFDGLYGTREQISDIASNEIENAWEDQFGITPTYDTTAEYQAWLYLNNISGAYEIGNYNAGLVEEPQPDMPGVHGGFSGNAESVKGVLEKSQEYYNYNEEYIKALEFTHSGILQSEPYKAAKILSEYTHIDKSLKIVWGHTAWEQTPLP